MVRSKVWSVLSIVAVALVTACSASGASNGTSPSASASTSTSTAATSSASGSPSAAPVQTAPVPTAVPTAPVQTAPAPTAPVQTPNADARVAWGHGEDPPGGDIGVPNPPGWYDYAFGGPTTQKVIYLTFDDGPAPPYTDEIMALLNKYGATATFFVVGQQVQAFPGEVKKIAAAGHAIGDHTQTHPNLNKLSAPQVRAQLADVQQEAGPAIGKCMRPPYGLIDTKGVAIAKSLGLTVIMWTGHALDWSSPPVSEMIPALKAATHPGAVILLHDGGGPRDHTVSALKQYLPWLQSRGYRMLAVPACLH